MTPPDDGTKSESDVGNDPAVAASREGKSDDSDETYVGETSPDDSPDVGETGAEARSKDA